MTCYALEALLKREEQRFDCVPAGPIRSQGRFVANIYHETTSPLTHDELTELEAHIGLQKQLFEMLSIYGSIRLYCDALSESSAYYLAHPTEWERLGKEFNIWVNDLTECERDSLLPSWLDDAVVIGEVPASGNFFFYLLGGESQGQVFGFDHDGFEFVLEGVDLFGFLTKISTVTEALLADIQSHTRYSDGVTDIQWLPIDYHYLR